MPDVGIYHRPPKVGPVFQGVPPVEVRLALGRWLLARSGTPGFRMSMRKNLEQACRPYGRGCFTFRGWLFGFAGPPRDPHFELTEDTRPVDWGRAGPGPNDGVKAHG